MTKYQRFFISEHFQFLEVKFSIYLNRRVFVMVRVTYLYFHCDSLIYSSRLFYLRVQANQKRTWSCHLVPVLGVLLLLFLL